MGPLRAYSCRPMERMIGRYKRLTNSRTASGENAGNIMESLALFAFLEDTGIAVLEPELRKPLYKDDTFEYHPSGVKVAPQLWDLAKTAFNIYDSAGSIANVSIDIFKAALNGYMSRLHCEGTKMQQVAITPAKRLWRDSQVISSALYSAYNKSIQRSSEYVMFESNYLT